MTTVSVAETVLGILSDLSRELPAVQRYERLLAGLMEVFPCDAAALLRLENSFLQPVAVQGLSDDTLGRRFAVDEQPRLARVLLSREPVRFPADSPLPDPYDGLIEDAGGGLHVHDCLGAALHIDDVPWGVLTLDAMTPDAFDDIDPLELRAFIRLAEATIKIAHLITGLRDRAEREHQVTQAVVAELGRSGLEGRSKAMEALRREIDVVADSDLAVLITGETGVGKEVVARRLHARSGRADNPIVYVNCAALPDNLVESELFGHLKGAFSGAAQSRAGKFELAHGGTLFLDEIGEMPLAIQPKLLRALQSGEVQRVGSDDYHRVDVRIIAATNRDLGREVAAGHFRADLFHRLSVYPIEVPPLRERGRDVLVLAGYFLEQNRQRCGMRAVRLDAGAREALLRYQWPGNVRELEHVIGRAVLRARADAGPEESARQVVTLGAAGLGLPETVTGVPHSEPLAESQPAAGSLPLRQATDAFQRRLITDALARHGGNRSRAAAELGVDRGNFSRLIKRLQLHESE